ncbi:MAG: cytochrome oxidase Cbb3 [Verrucomicrobiales bacterium]|nr:cytochrome oxidase Cbb3 [Verrucomicrobiales bacterium]
MNPVQTSVEFDDRTVRRFLIAMLFWGTIALLAGVLIAFQLHRWQLNGKEFGGGEGIEWLTFGRLRPVHTNAAIFAFVGNMMFAGIYYSTQRLCKVRMASDILSGIHFWGWQFIIVCAAVTLPLGLTRGKEYAELIWPINVLVAVVWVIFGLNFFLTLKRRNEPSLYVALWFYIATIITVAMLYIVNHLSIPTGWTHSYPLFGGVQDALIQWWYGHNAVAFFLTTPILGIMYYFMPKAAERPVYSYRLSIVHFWSLVFIYIWAGPHHLLNTALPYWLQMLGVLFSLMLWAPSWGGMLNGLLTLRGAWHKLRTDPVIKFFAAAVTFYGMATFEGPLLAIRSVNALSHYSDWTIGHVHSGTLGWNGFMAAGMTYWLVPRLWKTELARPGWANMHFWIGLVGILMYVAAMWISGITQGLMLNQLSDDGSLKYQFLDTLKAIRPLMLFRAIGGTLYLAGFVMMVINVWLSVRGREPVNGSIRVVVETPKKPPFWKAIFAEPVIFPALAITGYCLWFLLPGLYAWGGLVLGLDMSWRTVWLFVRHKRKWTAWYEGLLENWAPFSLLVLVAAAAGGMLQIIPTLTFNRAANVEDRLQIVPTPLELAGRDIYISEGCYGCHSQMVRTLAPEVLRYGDYSRLGESIFDYPFQWGSKRTGPDLAREAGKRNNTWHYQHLMDPRALSAGSNMPSYHWLDTQKTDLASLPRRVAVQLQLGVPYPAMTQDEIRQRAIEQGVGIAQDLRKNGLYVDPESRMVALIAYLQKLGLSEEVTPPERPMGAMVPITAQP